jgi:hypothetical protein
VYSEGNLKLCAPVDDILGRLPALGITFHERVKVTFLWSLEKSIALNYATSRFCAAIRYILEAVSIVPEVVFGVHGPVV